METKSIQYIQAEKTGNLLAEKNTKIEEQAELIKYLRGRLETIEENLIDLQKRPGDFMIIGTTLSVVRNGLKKINEAQS